MILKYNDIMPKYHSECFIAESADLIGRITIGKDSSVWYGTVIRADVESVTIGERTNVQDNSTIHVAHGFKTSIGDDVTIGHGAIVHACSIGNRVLIGMGAIVLDGAIVEDDVIIGAGALIPPGKVIPSKSLVVGSPGKVVRNLSEDDLENLLHSAKSYVEEANKHRHLNK